MKFQAPRGTEDILPSQSAIWQTLEHHFRTLVEKFGYAEIRTPAFEDSDLFRRTAGEASDIVTKEMYDFKDKGDRNVTLKPEGTAPAMRAVIQYALCPPGNHLRLWYLTQFFRYGRPARGRWRQAHQLGCELLGSSSAQADAEVLEIAMTFMAQIGLGDEPVMINSIGRDECRAKYREVVLQHMAAYLADQEAEARALAEKNPLGLLDSKDPKAKEALVGLAPITDFLEDDSKARFESLQELLTEAEVPYKVAPYVVRGLDYYTETVFEFESKHLEGLSLFGGGRYDNLVKEIGGPATPCVGFGIGVERVILALEAMKKLPVAKSPDVFVVAATADAGSYCRKLVRDLRAQGFRVEWDVDNRSFKSQLRQADKSTAPFAVLVGTEEIETETLKVRHLNKGEQREIPQQELSEVLRTWESANK